MNFDWKKPLMLLAIVAALIGSGCGGDDDGEAEDGATTTEPTGEALSADEYATRLGEILEPLGTELQEIGTATSQGAGNEDAIDGVSQASETLQGSIDELSAIVPPEEAADAHESIVSSLQGFKDAADEFASVDPGDEEAVAAALTGLQDAVVTFQTSFQEAITQLGEAGIEPPAPSGAG